MRHDIPEVAHIDPATARDTFDEVLPLAPGSPPHRLPMMLRGMARERQYGRYVPPRVERRNVDSQRETRTDLPPMCPPNSGLIGCSTNRLGWSLRVRRGFVTGYMQ